MKGPSTLFYYAVPDQNGIAPDSRIRTAWDAYFICDQLRRDNYERERRWSHVFKAYKAFPPTQYSELAKNQLFGLSNVPFRQLTYFVNEKKSAYVDMFTDRSYAAQIDTEIGNDKERKEWSEKISLAWDRALWEWSEYFYNFEQDLEEKLLFGKGIEIRIDRATWFTKSYHNYEVLIPDKTRASLNNLSEIALKDRYTLLEFWNKFKDSRPGKDGKAQGKWNFWACLDVLRYYTNMRERNQTPTQYLHKVDAGDINFNQYYNRQINVYQLLSQEWDGSITKQIVLQEYNPLVSPNGVFKNEEDYVNKMGFLYIEKNFAKDWSEVIVPFHGACGTGFWHEVRGEAEDFFPQSRQYDITMNKVIDAVNMEMMVPIKGLSADQTKKLKQMEWGKIFVLPEDVDFAQKQFQLPIGDAIQANNVMMQDAFRGLRSYGQIQRKGYQTAEESKLNFAEANKLDGVELRRFALCQTKWIKLLYKFFTECKVGWEGYEIFEKFKERMKKQGVPDEAWEYDNVRITSMLIPGAGSPANKAIAFAQVQALASMPAITEGQEEAIRDNIAALAGRDNVDRYRPRVKPDIPDQARVIAFENGVLSDPFANPENARVFPTDNHIEHIRGHFSDAMTRADRAMSAVQSQSIEGHKLAEIAYSLLNAGGHMKAHRGFLEGNKQYAAEINKIDQGMEALKGRVDEIIGIAREMMAADQEENPQQQTEEQLKLQALAAKTSIELHAQQQKTQIDLAGKAARSQQRLQIDKERAALKQATARVELKGKRRASEEQAGD